MLHELWLVIHVLGWVFWLGTDIGVYIAAKRSERTDLSVETRLAILDVGMLLDRAPRFAVPVVLGTGLLMANNFGFTWLPDLLVVAFTVGWILIVWLGLFKPPGSTLQRLATQAQTIIYVVVIIGMLAWGIIGLLGDSVPLWVAIKCFCYALIGIAAVVLDRCFTPAIVDYQTLATSGSTPALEAQLHQHLQPVYISVLAIYAGTAIAGISGLLKPVL